MKLIILLTITANFYGLDRNNAIEVHGEDNKPNIIIINDENHEIIAYQRADTQSVNSSNNSTLMVNKSFFKDGFNESIIKAKNAVVYVIHIVGQQIYNLGSLFSPIFKFFRFNSTEETELTVYDEEDYNFQDINNGNKNKFQSHRISFPENNFDDQLHNKNHHRHQSLKTNINIIEEEKDNYWKFNGNEMVGKQILTTKISRKTSFTQDLEDWLQLDEKKEKDHTRNKSISQDKIQKLVENFDVDNINKNPSNIIMEEKRVNDYVNNCNDNQLENNFNDDHNIQEFKNHQQDHYLNDLEEYNSKDKEILQTIHGKKQENYENSIKNINQLSIYPKDFMDDNNHANQKDDPTNGYEIQYNTKELINNHDINHNVQQYPIHSFTGCTNYEESIYTEQNNTDSNLKKSMINEIYQTKDPQNINISENMEDSSSYQIDISSQLPQHSSDNINIENKD